jgi:hypothetical protein
VLAVYIIITPISTIGGMRDRGDTIGDPMTVQAVRREQSLRGVDGGHKFARAI